MHRSDRSRPKIRDFPQVRLRLPCVWHVAAERPGIVFGQRLAGPVYDAGARHRLNISQLVEEVGAEERAVRLLKQKSGLPAMRQVWRLNKPECVFSGREGI